MKTPEELAYEFVKLAFRSKSDIRFDTAFIAGYNAGVASSHEQIKELEKRCHDLQEELNAIASDHIEMSKMIP